MSILCQADAGGIFLQYICNDCPRKCRTFRTETEGNGFCQSPALPRIVRAAPHFGEEPCISGTRGSGAVFFSSCSMRCVFCQNHEISRFSTGRIFSASELERLLLHLQDLGVHNINLVTPTHFSTVLVQVLEKIRLDIPNVWNSSGFEKVETLKRLEGLVQIYMPDMKFSVRQTASVLASAPDYWEVCQAAVREMYRQRGAYHIDDNGLLTSGLLIRHLILPGHKFEAMDVIDFVADEFPSDSVLFSLMSQYTPLPVFDPMFPELSQHVSDSLNQDLIAYMKKRHIVSGYWQSCSSAGPEMIPDFDGTGIDMF